MSFFIRESNLVKYLLFILDIMEFVLLKRIWYSEYFSKLQLFILIISKKKLISEVFINFNSNQFYLIEGF